MSLIKLEEIAHWDEISFDQFYLNSDEGSQLSKKYWETQCYMQSPIGGYDWLIYFPFFLRGKRSHNYLDFWLKGDKSNFFKKVVRVGWAPIHLFPYESMKNYARTWRKI